MKRLTEKLEKTFAAITFAEAGELEIAKEILGEEGYTHRKVTEREEAAEHIILAPKGQLS